VDVVEQECDVGRRLRPDDLDHVVDVSGRGRVTPGRRSKAGQEMLGMPIAVGEAEPSVNAERIKPVLEHCLCQQRGLTKACTADHGRERPVEAKTQ
jgi:hypothetical protein